MPEGGDEKGRGGKKKGRSVIGRGKGKRREEKRGRRGVEKKEETERKGQEKKIVITHGLLPPKSDLCPKREGNIE